MDRFSIALAIVLPAFFSDAPARVGSGLPSEGLGPQRINCRHGVASGSTRMEAAATPGEIICRVGVT